MHIFIVQRIDLDFRSMRYIKIDIIIVSITSKVTTSIQVAQFHLFLVCA